MNRILARRVLLAAVVPSAKLAVPLARALLQGGLDIMEVTLRNTEAAESIRRIRAEVPEMQIGAGTLLTIAQVQESRSAGAHFGVSPGFNPTIVRAARDCGFPLIPGAATPGEMERALELDSRIVKFFPAEVLGGVRFLRAIAAPYAHTGLRIIPFGGIGAHNMADYLAVPLVMAVGGSWIASGEAVAAQDWPAITERSRQAMKQTKLVC